MFAIAAAAWESFRDACSPPSALMTRVDPDGDAVACDAVLGGNRHRDDL